MNPERDLIDASVFAGVCEPAPAAEFIDLLLRTGFSPSAYRDRFGDLAARGFDPTQALAHFFKNGLRERRSVPMILDHRALLALARLPISNRWLRVHLLASLGGHLFDPKDTKSGAYIAERWPAVRALREAGARPYFIAGDSHAGWFVHGTGRDDAWLLPIHIPCSAGSARGLANPESVSGLADVLSQAGRIDEARRLLDEFLRSYPDQRKDLERISSVTRKFGSAAPSIPKP